MPGRLATERGVWSDAYRELLRPRTVAVALVSVALFAVAVTIFGPLGTLEALEPLPRFAYWGLCAAITFPLTYSVAAVALYLTRRRALIEIVPAVAVAVLFEGLLCTAVVLAADMMLIPARAPPLSATSTYLTVTVVVAVCTFFAHYVVFQRISQGRTAAGPAAPRVTSGTTTPGDAVPARPPPGFAAGRAPGTGGPRARIAVSAGRRSADRRPLSAPQARFLDRLSRTVSRDVIYLKAEDHYVQVQTTGGSCLVRKRFANAVADLGSLGMQVHRSYWVAHRHVLTTVRRDGRTMLRVTGGHNLPISRPYLAAVQEILRGRPFRPTAGEPAE